MEHVSPVVSRLNASHYTDNQNKVQFEDLHRAPFDPPLKTSASGTRFKKDV